MLYKVLAIIDAVAPVNAAGSFGYSFTYLRGQWFKELEHKIVVDELDEPAITVDSEDRSGHRAREDAFLLDCELECASVEFNELISIFCEEANMIASHHSYQTEPRGLFHSAVSIRP